MFAYEISQFRLECLREATKIAPQGQRSDQIVEAAKAYEAYILTASRDLPISFQPATAKLREGEGIARA